MAMPRLSNQGFPDLSPRLFRSITNTPLPMSLSSSTDTSPSSSTNISPIPLFSATSSQTSSPQVERKTKVNTKCSLCNGIFTSPKILGCFHTFCLPCLEQTQTCPDKIKCPDCEDVTFIAAHQGLSSGLMTNYVVNNVLGRADARTSSSATHCTFCKNHDVIVIAHCFDCPHFLCSACFMDHRLTRNLERHHVTSINNNKLNAKTESLMNNCPRHNGELLQYFCNVCAIPVCKQCVCMEHSGDHDCHLITDVASKQTEAIEQLVEEGRHWAREFQNGAKGIEHVSSKLQVQYKKAQNDINDTFKFYCTVLDNRKRDALRELEDAFQGKKMALETVVEKIHESTDRIYGGCNFGTNLLSNASPTERLLFTGFIDAFLRKRVVALADMSHTLTNVAFSIEFVYNFQAIESAVKSTFGYLCQTCDASQPIIKSQHTEDCLIPNSGKCITSKNPLIFGSVHPEIQQIGHTTADFATNDRWYPLSNVAIVPWEQDTDLALTPDHLSVLASQLAACSVYPPRSLIKRQKMIYHCKFGEYGSDDGQFLEPSGVTVNLQNEIFVADTNNHRIQVFDKDGQFKFQFGQYGRHGGQLMYPNRVAIVKSTGEVVVTERSPTHQIQIYSSNGQFVRKFGANILQHPRGVAVDNKERIVIVECKVMRVMIFDMFGHVLNKFGCSKYLEFPNGVVVNDDEEIFISDNRAHSVKVFNYEGVFLRQIGGEGITNYPIGVGMGPLGEIVIADNHNNFNLSVFTQDGQLISALESKVKHAQCFDVALLNNGSVVLASKDLRIYLYRYMQ